MTDLNLLYTVGGYIAIIGAGYTVYHFSTRPDAKKRALAAAKAKATQPEARKEDRKKKQRLEAFAQDSQSSTKATRAAPEAKEPEASVTNVRDTMDDSAANREFALQLAKAQEGTKFAAKTDSKQREKYVKQSKASQLGGAKAAKADAPAPAPAPAPAAPAPAESEASASVDESVEDETAAVPAEAGRVDDMLEPKAAAPSVLRLTDTKPTEQKKASKPAEKTETKKQRQNRKKAEAAKAARDEAETERKSLEEKQRRQARIAEGRAAKDGSQFTNGATAAWKQGASNGVPKTNGDLHQPLDTFEVSAAPAVKTNGTPSAAPAVVESQPRAAEEEWSTVKPKSFKKKAPSNASADEAPAPAPEAAPKAAPAAKQAAPKTNGNGANSKKAVGGSFSALTNNDEVEDEEEVEWDV